MTAELERGLKRELAILGVHFGNLRARAEKSKATIPQHEIPGLNAAYSLIIKELKRLETTASMVGAHWAEENYDAEAILLEHTESSFPES